MKYSLLHGPLGRVLTNAADGNDLASVTALMPPRDGTCAGIWVQVCFARL